MGQRTEETLAAARNLLHGKGNWPRANVLAHDIHVGLEVLLAGTLDGTVLSKELQLEAPTAWPENNDVGVPSLGKHRAKCPRALPGGRWS